MYWQQKMHIGRSNTLWRVLIPHCFFFSVCIMTFHLCSPHWWPGVRAQAEKQEELPPVEVAYCKALGPYLPVLHSTYSVKTRVWWLWCLTDSLKSRRISNQQCTQMDWHSLFIVMLMSLLRHSYKCLIRAVFLFQSLFLRSKWELRKTSCGQMWTKNQCVWFVQCDLLHCHDHTQAGKAFVVDLSSSFFPLPTHLAISSRGTNSLLLFALEVRGGFDGLHPTTPTAVVYSFDCGCLLFFCAELRVIPMRPILTECRAVSWGTGAQGCPFPFPPLIPPQHNFFHSPLWPPPLPPNPCLPHGFIDM